MTDSIQSWLVFLEDCARLDRTLTPDQRLSAAVGAMGIANFHLRRALDDGATTDNHDLGIIAGSIAHEMDRARRAKRAA